MRVVGIQQQMCMLFGNNLNQPIWVLLTSYVQKKVSFQIVQSFRDCDDSAGLHKDILSRKMAETENQKLDEFFFFFTG